jgi:purine-binding chemotaxis protein CheW
MIETDNRLETFVVFELAGTTYAVRSDLIQQMEMVEDVTPVPNAPSALEGVVFSRGRVIPALNLRVRFGFERIPLSLRTRLIVVNISGRTVGLIVDTAREFISIPADAIQPPSETISGLSGKYLEGIARIGDRIVLVLDLNEVMNLGDIVIVDPQLGISAQAEAN